MRHDRDDAGPIVIRDYATFKQDKARAAKRIEVRQLDMASRRIAADYPELAAWFCFMVRRDAEFSTEVALNAVDIHALVPTRIGEEMRRRGRFVAGAVVPVMPGYVIVRCVPSASAIAGLLRFKAIIGVVGHPERPFRVPNKNMDEFIQKAADGGYDYAPPAPVDFHAPPVHFHVGESVRVTDGPFASFPGTVVDWDGARGRLSVEVGIFGRPTPVELGVAQVEKV